MTRAVILALSAWTLSSSALACSCVMLSPEDRVAQAELIFIGTAKSSTHTDEEGSDTMNTIFAIKEMLKGEGKPGEDAYVFHPQNLGGNCGIDFEAGKEFLVLAHEEDDLPATTNLCTMAGVEEAAIREALKKAKPAK